MAKPYDVCRDVYLVGDSEVSHPYDCCVYLLDAGDLVLIDAGAGLSFETIMSNIETLGFDPGRITTVLATDGHMDHIGALHRFQQVYGSRIVAHDLDAEAIE